MKVNSLTEKTGLLGHPVGHSKSPDMHNEAFALTGFNMVYLAYDVSPEKLPQAVEGMRALGFRGWNVTIPHKVAIMELLDELDDSAKEIGAVNTVVNKESRLIGYNTDGTGYLRSLQEETAMQLTGKRVVLVGAGGAARAVGYALATAGVREITVTNRTTAKAEALASRLSRWVPTRVITAEELQTALQDAALLVQTTSVGMHPDADVSPVNPDWLHSGLVVSDLIYHPRKTKLLQEAEKQGACIHGGAGMLVHQAALAFELWTGHPAPVKKMREVLERSLAPV
ncbi:shikimate dehydrogenase (NADP(+)) [Marinithermofilum abyssi]|uniref:Shikimate dehydrogenase (NADP(+)) n=1 Tax=Marinithermofilum abyssi TaxID=1571185 RepID=A0A8J2VEX8_9BACL|nr:shikimate dehydrogenase [Marinithermofilum abyssi]GGE14186.1 shikimate dehydrogenase (NADP(+)) [Marinithermofilum abyssi]